MQDARLMATDGRDSWGTRPDDRLNTSRYPADRFMKMPATQKIVSGKLPVYKRPLTGTHANRDVYVPLT